MGGPNIAMMEVEIAGITQCEAVTIDPYEGTTPRSVSMFSNTPGGRLFWTIATLPGTPPTHSGATATGSTFTVNANHVVVGTGTGNKSIQAICYRSDLLDSGISYGEYIEP